MAVIGGGGIQPERLNAEGDSPSARSRGLSVSATPGTVCLQGKRLKDAKVAAKEADFRVFQTHNSGRYDTEGCASLHPRLRATRSARAFDLSGRAAGGFTTDFHGIRHGFSQDCVYLCFICDNLCLLCRGGMRGIQPERLNAEGDSPSALSRGLSVSATPGTPTSTKKSV